MLRTGRPDGFCRRQLLLGDMRPDVPERPHVTTASAPPALPAVATLPDRPALPTLTILGTVVHPLGLEASVDWAEQAILTGRRVGVCHVGAHSVLEARDCPEFAAALRGADLCTLDGMPLVWIGRWRNRVVERVPGPEFMTALLRRTGLWADRRCRHFLYGSTPDVLAALSKAIADLAPGVDIVGVLSPPFRALSEDEEQALVATINAAEPDVVWVGLGAPRQELWLARNRPHLTAPVVSAVGAAFDFVAGTKPKAPRWMQQAGLEWLFRMGCEPRRLGPRYLKTVPRFLWLMVKDAVRGGTTSADL